MRVDALHVWEEKAEVRCEIGGIVFGYPKADVERIEKGRSTVKVKKAEATVIKVHKEVPVVPEEKASVPKKEAVAAKQETIIPEKEASVSKEPKEVPSRAAPAKKIPVPKKEKSPKAAAPQYASIPMFEEIINEDDNNPPAYIKRRRVLLVPRGLAKARIRALLLSYEKKLRNELNAQKAQYKLIVVWVYDDFDRADEGAAGWVGMISNEQRTEELADNPVVSIR
jgi:hypothetical protein